MKKYDPWLLMFLVIVGALLLAGAIAPWQVLVAFAVAALFYLYARSRR